MSKAYEQVTDESPSENSITEEFDRSIEYFKNVPQQKLSKREKECLEWTSVGKTSYEISLILGVSENTINNYISNAMRKFGAVNRSQLVAIAIRSNIIK